MELTLTTNTKFPTSLYLANLAVSPESCPHQNFPLSREPSEDESILPAVTEPGIQEPVVSGDDSLLITMDPYLSLPRSLPSTLLLSPL